MDFDKFSDRLKGFIQSAQTLALRDGNQQITPEHLLKVLLDDPEGLAAGLIDRAGGNAEARRCSAPRRRSPSCRRSRAAAPGSSIWRRRCARVFDRPSSWPSKAGDSFVTVERLLQALAHGEGGRGRQRILADAGRHAAGAQRRHQRAAQGPHRRFGRRRAGL